VLLVFAVSVRADFGGYSGDSDYGGSDGSYDSGGSRDSSDPGGGGIGFFQIIRVFLLLFFAVCISLAIVIAKKRRSASKRGTQPQGAARTDPSRLKPLSEYTRLDPSFRAGAMQQQLAGLYLLMQNTWQARDISPVRPYFTDIFYAQMERQLAAITAQGRTNHIEDISVLSVELRGYFQEGGMDVMVAELRTRITTFTTEDTTGKIVAGDRNAERFMTYEWHLIRRSGSLTMPQQQTLTCRSCGAPVPAGVPAKCPHCGTAATPLPSGWALTAIRGIRQVTRRT